MPLTRAFSAATLSRLGATTPLQRRAATLLRAAARAVPLTVCATPATVTQGAANAAPTLKSDGTAAFVTASTANANGQQLHWGDARLADVSGAWAPDPDNAGVGYIATHVSNRAAGGRRGHTWGAGKRFGFDGGAFEVVLAAGAGSYPCQIRVAATDLATGARQWATAGDVVMAADSSFHAVRVDFGAAAPRIVEVYVGGATAGNGWTRSLVVRANDTVWAAPQADEPRIAVFGDSWTFGLNVASFRTSLAHTVGERFGANVVVSAVSGSGVLVPVNGFTWRQRVANGDLDASRLGALDLVLVPYGASINDGGQTDAAVQAEVALLIQAVMAAQPGAIILAGGPEYIPGGMTTAARYAAVQAGVLAAGGGDPRVVYLDNSPAGEAWTFGTSTSTTLTAAPSGATSGTLSAAWGGASGAYTLLFSDGSLKPATLTNGAAAVSWTGAVTAPTAAVRALQSGNFCTYTGPDGSHLNAAGNVAVGRRIADSVVNQLRALAA